MEFELKSGFILTPLKLNHKGTKAQRNPFIAFLLLSFYFYLFTFFFLLFSFYFFLLSFVSYLIKLRVPQSNADS